MTHTMTRIEREYGEAIKRTARRHAPKGTDVNDMYVDILIAVHERVEAGRVDIKNVASMRNTIRQRAIDICRREALRAERFKSLDTLNGESVVKIDPVTEKTRVAELKQRIRRALPRADARIICEIAFPSRKVERFAESRPFRRTKRKPRTSVRLTVRKWHVAECLGITTGRIGEAIRIAREKIDEILA